ncbi:MAG: hemerythrin domain-containing protein [Minicystis sp.]
MKATSLLKAQHEEVESLFKRIEKSKDDAKKRELFEELAGKLVSHDGIEREIFYPACKKAMGKTDLLGEAMVEHGVIEFSLYLADQAQGKEDFDEKVTVLREIIEHHVKEEEHDLFPKVQKAMTTEQLEELGTKMEARFEAALKKDFRGPLHKNLRLVLEGASEIPNTKNAKDKNGGAKKKGAAAGRIQA